MAILLIVPLFLVNVHFGECPAHQASKILTIFIPTVLIFLLFASFSTIYPKYPFPV